MGLQGLTKQTRNKDGAVDKLIKKGFNASDDGAHEDVRSRVSNVLFACVEGFMACRVCRVLCLYP